MAHAAPRVSLGQHSAAGPGKAVNQDFRCPDLHAPGAAFTQPHRQPLADER